MLDICLSFVTCYEDQVSARTRPMTKGRYPRKRRNGDENINEGARQALGWKDSGPLLKHACPRPTPYLNSPALLAPPLLITTKFTCRHEKVLNGALASCCNSLPLILYNDRSGRGFKSGS